MDLSLSTIEALIQLARKYDLTDITVKDFSAKLAPSFSEKPTTINDEADKESRAQVIREEVEKILKDDEELLAWST